MAQSWLKRTMNDPALGWTRPRRTRRLLVAAFLAWLGLLCGVLWLAGARDWLVAGAMLGSVPVMVLAIGALNGSIRGLTELSGKDLDEWERARRDPVYARAYPIATVAALIAGLLAAGLALEMGQRLAIFFGAFMLILMLPTLILAWTLPEEPGEDL